MVDGTSAHATSALGRLETVDPKKIWLHEALNFTPWLLENAQRLAEAIGIEIELDATEHPVGGFSLDIIGRDQTNGVVLIVENQLAGSDHGHLGQLLTYAAGTSASTIVWITTRFRDEHRQALTWLNEHTDPETHFFGVELEVVRIGDSIPAPLFNVVAQPNNWQKAIRVATSGQVTSGRGELYRGFWSLYLERVKANHPSWTRANPTGQNWLWMASPFRGCGICSVFASNNTIRHELYIDRSTVEECRALFDALLARRDEFEAAYGRSLQWDSVEGRKARRIFEQTTGDVQNIAEYETFIRFFLDAGAHMRKAIDEVRGAMAET